MTDLPPFKAGQQAYSEGQPCNPPEGLEHEETYPTARQMWLDGWNVAKGIAEHTAEIRKRGKANAVG